MSDKSEWYPISTAPKDGTVIILTWMEDGEPMEQWVMRWVPTLQNALFPGKVGMWASPGLGITWNEDNPAGAPTHWKPSMSYKVEPMVRTYPNFIGPTKQEPPMTSEEQEQQAQPEPTDEGVKVLNLQVLHNETQVVVNFGTSIVWLGLTPGEARALAAALLEHATQVPNQGYQS